MKRYKIIIIMALLLFSALMLTSCITPISKVKENPDKYIGKEVIFYGEVKNIFQVPFVKVKFYQIEDDTDSIFVFSKRDIKVGEKIEVKGTLLILSAQMTKEKAAKTVAYIEKFLVKNNFADKKEAKEIAEKLMNFLLKILPKKSYSILLLENYENK